MQEQIHKFNYIANSDEYADDVREYAKGLANFLWAFQKVKSKQDKVNEKMFELMGKYK